MKISEILNVVEKDVGVPLHRAIVFRAGQAGLELRYGRKNLYLFLGIMHQDNRHEISIGFRDEELNYEFIDDYDRVNMLHSAYHRVVQDYSKCFKRIVLNPKEAWKSVYARRRWVDLPQDRTMLSRYLCARLLKERDLFWDIVTHILVHQVVDENTFPAILRAGHVMKIPDMEAKFYQLKKSIDAARELE